MITRKEYRHLGTLVEHQDTLCSLCDRISLFLGQQRRRPCLGEEVDAVGDCVHGDRVSSDEEASKVHSGQVVEFGVQTGQLPDVVADHVE